jgi:hypothetical protein
VINCRKSFECGSLKCTDQQPVVTQITLSIVAASDPPPHGGGGGQASQSAPMLRPRILPGDFLNIWRA